MESNVCSTDLIILFIKGPLVDLARANRGRIDGLRLAKARERIKNMLHWVVNFQVIYCVYVVNLLFNHKH